MLQTSEAELPLKHLLEKLKDDKQLDIRLEGGGRIYIDRPLPFLSYCRLEEGETKSATAALLSAQPAYIWQHPSEEVVHTFLCEAMAVLYKRYGAFLLLELREHDEKKGLIEYVEDSNSLAFVQRLGEELKRLFPLQTQTIAEVEVREMPVLIQEKAGMQFVRLTVPSRLYRQSDGKLYPMSYRRFRGQLNTTLRKAFFDFVRLQTRYPVSHYNALGRRHESTLVWEIDQALVEISQSFEFLLLTSVLNHQEAWAEFQKHRYQQAPNFRYRLIPLDPDLVKRRLYQLPIEEVEDPTLAFILRDKRTELDKMLNMLLERATPHFPLSSVQVFGDIEEWLLKEAEQILETFPEAYSPEEDEGGRIDAYSFAELARKEIQFLKDQYEPVEAKVEIRKDINGLMVSSGRLLIGETYQTSRLRAEALLQHEVGTHVLTYFNGKAQPLQLLRSGTPGYEDLQEGLAVLAEYFVGGLTVGRLRTLAARVVAVERMLRRDTFPECFKRLHEQYGFSPRTAYGIVERVYRGGGMTKDAVYLRGLICLLRHLEQGHDLESLLIGKIQQSYLPFIQELIERRVLQPAPILPRYMQLPDFKQRLTFLRKKIRVADLVSAA